MRATILILTASVLALGACSPGHHLEGAQFWGRKETTSALYMQGPKAQQTLHQDIAACVDEIDELVRLGEIREVLPGETVNGVTPNTNTAEGRMARWDTPERDGYLRADHSDYHDFETCMDAKGWERMEYLPYAQADRARAEYLHTMGQVQTKRHLTNREYVTSVHSVAQTPPPYKNLNE